MSPDPEQARADAISRAVTRRWVEQSAALRDRRNAEWQAREDYRIRLANAEREFVAAIAAADRQFGEVEVNA